MTYIHKRNASTIIAVNGNPLTAAASNIPNGKDKKRWHQAADTLDQFERFQECDTENAIPGGAHHYWINRLDDPCESLLAQMGVELMCIPAMSDEPQCVFSRAKWLISDLRNRLGDDIIQPSKCLKSWIQQGFVFEATESDMVRMEQMLQDLASRSG